MYVDNLITEAAEWNAETASLLAQSLDVNPHVTSADKVLLRQLAIRTAEVETMLKLTAVA